MPSTGIEPVSQASEACVLSVKLRGRTCTTKAVLTRKSLSRYFRKILSVRIYIFINQIVSDFINISGAHN